ncbi:MAG: hypothetical protein WBW46_00460 [Candidatus Sulfotelmatobacter sp.]
MKVTHCPAGPQITHFDRIQFGPLSKMPVEGHAGHDEEGNLTHESRGLSYGDFGRMQMFSRVLARGRRYDAPSFSLNDRDLRIVICHAVERRAYGNGVHNILGKLNHNGKPLVERLRAAEDVCRQRARRLSEVLDRLCVEYVSKKASHRPEDRQRCRRLEALISGVDTQLRIDAQPAAVYAFILYSYFRTGASSAQIAGDLGLPGSAPLIRQITFRILRMAREDLHFRLGDAITQRRDLPAFSARRCALRRAISA